MSKTISHPNSYNELMEVALTIDVGEPKLCIEIPAGTVSAVTPPACDRAGLMTRISNAIGDSAEEQLGVELHRRKAHNATSGAGIGIKKNGLICLCNPLAHTRQRGAGVKGDLQLSPPRQFAPDSIGSLLNIDAALDEVFKKCGVPRCDACGVCGNRVLPSQALANIALNCSAGALLLVSLLPLEEFARTPLTIEEYLSLYEPSRVVWHGVVLKTSDFLSSEKALVHEVVPISGLGGLDLGLVEDSFALPMTDLQRQQLELRLVSELRRRPAALTLMIADIGSGRVSSRQEVSLNFSCPQCRGALIPGSAGISLEIGQMASWELPMRTAEEFLEWQARQCELMHAGSEAALPLSKAVRGAETLMKLKLGQLHLGTPIDELSNTEMLRFVLVMAEQLDLSGCIIFFAESLSMFTVDEACELFPFLRELAQRGNTCLIVSEEPVLLKHCDAVFAVNSQAAKAQGKHDETKARPATALGNLVISGLDIYGWCVESLSIPLGRIIRLHGASGTGKTRLIRDIIPIAVRKEATVGMSAAKDLISTVRYFARAESQISSRHLAASYLEMLPPIGKLLSASLEARLHGITEEYFAFSLGGPYRCSGKALLAKFNGLNMSEILALTAAKAELVFNQHKKIGAVLSALRETGLGELRLGVLVAELSPLQCILLFLAKCLSASGHRRAAYGNPGQLFLLDYPFVGLSSAEQESLFLRLTEITRTGHTVICVDNAQNARREYDYSIGLKRVIDSREFPWSRGKKITQRLTAMIES